MDFLFVVIAAGSLLAIVALLSLDVGIQNFFKRAVMPEEPLNMEDFIFVFGSNQMGYHGGGAALYAHRQKGAEWGVGEGRTGQSYALPTKVTIRETMDLMSIKACVDTFISYANEHPELRFQVTMVGCGLAGLRSEDIAPMFEMAPDNCWFDTQWAGLLHPLSMTGHRRKFWGTF